MFEDKEFAKLDEISQLIEPMVYSLNNKIIACPDRAEVPYEIIAEVIGNRNGNDCSISIDHLLSKLNMNIDELPYNQDKKFFTIVAENAFDHGILSADIDFSTKSMNTKIFIEKHTSCYTDNEMHARMCNLIQNILQGATSVPSRYDKTRLNEVAIIFDLLDVKKERSSNGKRREFILPLIDKIKDYTINIRDVDLGVRFAGWIRDYIRYGKLSAIKNLCKLKVMTHNGKGIYSIQDED